MIRFKLFRQLVLIITALFCLPSHADSQPIYQFDNSQQSTRFHQLNETLRCPKCQNQNIAGSDAPISIDLKNAVHQQIMEGKTDQQIIDSLKAKYGDFIIYKPPFTIYTLLLWLLPPCVLIFSFIVFAFKRK